MELTNMVRTLVLHCHLSWKAHLLVITNLILSAIVIPHLFAGWTSHATMNSDQAVISIPITAPTGAQYAWVMAGQPCDFTQIGWAWGPAYATIAEPVEFAYTQTTCKGPGTWAFGIPLIPGGTIRVRIVRTGRFYTDQVYFPGMSGLAAQWMTLQTAHLSKSPLWIVDTESYGPMEQVCFAGRGCVG